MKASDAVNDRVEQSQWQVAQTWEREFWLRQQKNLAKLGKNHIWRLLSLFGVVEKYRGDDDNQWWSKCFDDYRFLPARAENVIEVGCGPYTNMRLVRKACEPKHLFLSDPLIRTYVGFKMTFVHEMYRVAGCYLDDHPLENLPYRDNFFDLAIMLNVLDHVQDANACMQSLARVVRSGGFIIVGQDLTNEEDLRSHPDGMRTGHPITLNEDWFRPHFEGKFDPIINKVLPRGAGRTPQWHYGTLLFAGTKK
jgi:ubiquinone/menaquinone biosynthesis C-methylase UbiE